MVFAAGRGTRMRPLTDTLPKPLVEVGGRSLLDRTLDALAEAGVETAIVNIHHLADRIEASLSARETPRVILSDERALLLDQGGGIAKVLPCFEGRPFYICNTDAFWIGAGDDNLLRLARLWDEQKMDVALLLARRVGSVGVDWDGDFHKDADGRLTRRASGETADFVYAGIGIVTPRLFEAAKEEVFPLAPFFFRAAEQGRLFGVELDGRWLHVGTMAAIEEAEAALAEARAGRSADAG
jgi:MurNAc alpha-1-phosphate uridylyltransferase